MVTDGSVFVIAAEIAQTLGRHKSYLCNFYSSLSLCFLLGKVRAQVLGGGLSSEVMFFSTLLSIQIYLHFIVLFALDIVFISSIPEMKDSG